MHRTTFLFNLLLALGFFIAIFVVAYWLHAGDEEDLGRVMSSFQRR
jgi:hypothetical protein